MRNISLILFLLMAGVFTNKSSAQAVILKADTLEVPCISSDTFLVPLRLDNFTNVSGLQFTLQWDTARLDYAFVTMLHPQFSGVGFDTSAATLALGKLTFAWTDLAGISLPSNTVMFKVAFRRIGGPPASISFVDDPTAIAVFDNQFDELIYQIQNGLVKPIDSVGPTLTCPTNFIGGGSGPTAILGIAPDSFNDDCGTPVVGWTSVGATVADSPNDPDASGTLFNIGLSTVTYMATDAGGNTATCSFDILLEFSVTTTDLTLIANTNNLASCGETVTIDVLAFNFDSIAGLQFSMGWLPTNLEFVSITNTNVPLNIGLSHFNLDSTGVGFFTFAWTSADLNGAAVPAGDVLFTLTYNVLGSATVDFIDFPTETLAFIGPSFDETTLITFDATVSVIDTLPPIITCPADITVQAPGTTSVQGISADVIDNCAAPSIGWSVSGDTNGNYPNDADASGGLFNIGTSNVTYLTTDAGGNTASCSFNVTVEFANTSTELTIVANSTNASCGGTFGIDFSALNFTTVAAVQFTVLWDPALYQYTSVSNFNLPIGIGVGNFGIDSVGVGFITFAWTSSDLNGVSVNNADVLFRLNFNLLNNTPSGILFGDDPTMRVAFDGGTFDEIPLMTVDGQVNVADNVPPTIECPTPAPVDAPPGQLFATVNGLDPITLTDNCAGVPVLSYTQSGVTANSGSGNADGDYNAGTTTVVYTATDANNNTATCSFEVVVDAGTPLILQLDTVDLGCQGAPTQVTVNLTVQNFIDIIGLQFGLNWDPLVLQLVMPVPIQYITAGPPPIFVNQGNGTLAFFGGHPAWPDVPNDSAILTLTFNVLDVNGLATTNLFFVGPYDALSGSFQPVSVQTINGAFLFSLDNVPPVITCPTDTVLNALPQACDADFIPPAPSATDACGTVGSITFTPAINVFTAGPPTTVTYTVTDNSGNSSTCNFNVTVLTNNTPQVTGCPVGPIVVSANNLCQGNASWTPPTFQDVCGQPLDTIINDYDPGGLFTAGTTLVNYTAIDLSGNSTTCSFEVVVNDMTAPTVICPNDTVITPINGCSAIVDYVIIATDACDPDLTFICSDTSGALFSGVSPVICAIVDDAGNVANCAFSITILDTAPPTFLNGCPTNINVVSASGNCGANPIWLTPTVMDSCDQSVTLMPSQASGSFFDVAGSPHTVTYTATDDQGNVATCNFTVTVADSTKPVLSNCPSLPIVKVLPIDSCTVTLNWTPPTATDNCGADSLTLTSNLNPGPFPTGDTTVVYTATDGSGNVSICFFNISVKDVVPPWFIDCPTQPLVIPNGTPCGNVVNFTFPTGMDNCTPGPELMYTSSFMPGDTFIVGTTQFPVRVTDASGNFAECFMTITIMGQVASFTNVPVTINVTGCDTHVTWASPIPVGFCPPITIDSSHASGSVFPFGTTTVMYTATDTFNNIATATFNVVVTETVAPVIDCPVSPIVVSVGGVVVSDPSNFLTDVTKTNDCNGVLLSFNLPTATDNCVTPTVSLLQGLASGSLFPTGFNNLVFRAVDSSGNLSQCAVFIEVVGMPDLAPVVTPNPGCVGDSITITVTDIPGATYTWTGPLNSATNVLTINSLSQQTDGEYIVTADVNGCTAGPDTAFVYLPLAPVAENDLTYTIDPGATETFSSVLENDNLSPAFDFEICDTSFLQGLVMNFNDGTFTYTAGEEPGMASFVYKVCSKSCPLDDQAAVTILIRDTECKFIPNIITPNGDPINEYFVIPCIDSRLFDENSLAVYNQWGSLVFEATPYLNDWNGTLNNEPGKNLPDGVYFYIFKPGPNAPPMKGFVEVFR
ncbi:MAG: HYR domain-containing protein [Phycisphaerae bacterium]|nr:HYR domain-containing protein [Saprospiraceae bacterium]